MATITIQQQKEILNSLPPNLNAKAVFQGLIDKGNKLEGFNDNIAPSNSKEDNTNNQTINQEDKSVKGFASNFIQSAGNFVKGIYNTVRHPINTATMVSNVGQRGLEKITGLSTGSDAPKNTTNAIGKMLEERYGSLDAVKNTAYNDPVGFLADASTLLDLGGGLLSTASKTGKLSKVGETISDASKFVEPMQTVAKTSQALIPKKTLSDIAQKVYESALKPSTKLSSAEKSEILLTGLKEGIPVTEGGLKMTQNSIDAINGSIAEMIKTAGEQGKQVSTLAIREKLNEVFDVVSKTVNPDSHVAELAKVEKDFMSNYGDFIPIDVAQEVKQNTYRILRKAYGEMKSTSVEGQKALARGIKEEIVKQYPEIGSLNSKESSLINFEDELQKAVNRINNHNLVGLGAIGAGGVGSVVAGAGGGALALITKSILDNPAVKSKFAILLQKIADKGVLKGGLRQNLTNTSRINDYTSSSDKK